MEIIQTPLLRLKIKNWMKYYFKNNISRINFEILKNLF